MATAHKVREALQKAVDAHRDAHRDHLAAAGLLDHLDATRGGVGLSGGPVVAGGNDG